MKFSVLIPTRNRLDLLKYAIETVRRQDYGDWEIIVSDNCSQEDVGGYVASLADSRIKYSRTDNFVSATDNWNNALGKSSGDYVIMIGDDDGLVNGYFRTMHSLTEEYSEPDVLNTMGYNYAYPGVMPGYPNGYLAQTGCAEFLKHSKEPFFLDPKLAFGLVKDSFQLKLRFDFSMQYSMVSRKLINSLSERGPFFQSPFPDFYASNVSFLKAKRILIYPHSMVIIGISPKSHGFYYYNARYREGLDFLKVQLENEVSKELRSVILPGDYINTAWLMALELIRANYGSEFNLHVGYNRYRSLQVLGMFENFYLKNHVSREEFLEFRKLMRSWERIVYGLPVSATMLLDRVFGPSRPPRLTKSLLKLWVRELAQMPNWHAEFSTHMYSNIIEVFEQIQT